MFVYSGSSLAEHLVFSFVFTHLNTPIAVNTTATTINARIQISYCFQNICNNKCHRSEHIFRSMSIEDDQCNYYMYYAIQLPAVGLARKLVLSTYLFYLSIELHSCVTALENSILNARVRLKVKFSHLTQFAPVYGMLLILNCVLTTDRVVN